MQAVLVLLAVAGSTAWLAVDASKRDWTDNSFGRNVQSWVLGALLLWPLVFPMYVFVHRKKAPLKAAPKAKPVPAVAMSASGPSEQYGPSIDEVEELEQAQPDPVVEVEPDPVIEKIEPEPTIEPDPVVHVEPEPVVEPMLTPEPDPVVELEPEPDPVVEFASEPDPVVEPEPEPVAEVATEPVAETYVTMAGTVEPVSESAAPMVETVEPAVETIEPVVESAEPVAEVETSEPAPQPEPKPLLDISHPDIPTEEAPPGLSVDAFKDIKPVAFGGAVLDDEPAPVAEPAAEPVADVQPEPTVEPEPVVEPEPEPVAAFEPLSYPLDSEPVIEHEPELEFEPVTAAMDETPVAEEPALEEAKPKKRGFRIPNPELKLPSFGKKKAASVTATSPQEEQPKPKRGLKLPSTGLKLPQITLPETLQGPLSDLERKILLGSVVAVLAAGAFGYSTAPADEAAPAPAPAPAAASR